MAAQNKNTTWSRVSHVNGNTLGCLRGQAKWPTGAQIRLPLEFCIFTERMFYEKTRYKSSDRSAEAIRRSSWPIHYCLEKLNRAHTHPISYCTSHAHRGLRLESEFPEAVMYNWLYSTCSTGCNQLCIISRTVCGDKFG